MTTATAKNRRAHGSGSVWTEPRKGYAVWMGQIRVDGVQKQKVLGRVRTRGGNDGLTRAFAERALRAFRTQVEEEMRAAATPAPVATTLEEVAKRHFAYLQTVLHRKERTVAGYESM